MSTNNTSMTSDKFLELAFQDTPPVDYNTNNSNIEELNKIFAVHTVVKPEGGASGASIYLLFDKNKNLKYVFKYSVLASKYINKKRQRSNSTNSISSNISTSSTSSNISNISTSLSLNKQHNISKYNGDQKYVRTIRENYLSKKFTEIQINEKEKITPKAIKIGFLKDFTLIIKDQKLKINPEKDEIDTLEKQINNFKKDNRHTKDEKKEYEKKNEIIKKNSKENTYIPFILQEGAKGTELENYVFKEKKKKNKKLDDTLCYNILYQLAISLMKFNKLIKRPSNNKYIGCHRDMHPGNIFVIQKDEKKSDVSIMFIDFDLSITNTSKLTSGNNCTRKTLSSVSDKVLQQYIKTTATYTNRKKIGVFVDKLLSQHELFKEDADLYQYMAYYTFYYDNVKSNYIKLFLKDSLEKAIETINKNLQNKNLKYKFLESLTQNLSPPKQNPNK